MRVSLHFFSRRAMNQTFFYLCRESLRSPFTLKTPDELRKFSASGEYHTSICCYDEEMLEYMQSHSNSPAGFSGKCYGENYVLDIDQPILQREGKLMAARVAAWLKSKDLEFYCFTSGNKGFHFYVPSSQIEVPESMKGHFNLCNRSFRNMVAKGIIESSPIFSKAKITVDGVTKDNIVRMDEQIYGLISTIRFPFSKHPSSGRRKINIKYTNHSEGEDFKEDESFSMINDSVVCKTLYGREDTPTVKLALQVEGRVYTPAVTSSETPKTVALPYGKPACIFLIKNKKDLKGTRRKTALVLISYYRSECFNKTETRQLIKSWSDNLNEPLDEREIDEVMVTYDKGYKYSCEDPIKKSFCTAQCMFSQTKDTNENNTWEAGSHAENFYQWKLNQESMIGGNELDLSALYHGLDKVKLNALMGQILVLCGASGAGKTTLLINIMGFFKWINFLVFSYDMSKEELIERMMIMKELDVNNPEHRKRFDNEITNVDIIDDTEIPLNLIEVHRARMERLTHKKYHAIVYDYLDYIPVEGMKDDFARNGHIAKTLRKISKRTKTIQIMLVQVPKEKGGNGNLPLDMTAPANSSNITNVSHIVLTFWRDFKGISGKTDNVFSLCVAKYRSGRADYTVRLRFIGEKFQLRNITERENNDAEGRRSNNGLN